MCVWPRVYAHSVVPRSGPADGEGVAYQWYHNGAAVPGPHGTQRTLAFPKLAPAHEGTYHVVVSNPDGAVRSEDVHVSIPRMLPRIVVQPEARPIRVQDAFSVHVRGTAVCWRAALRAGTLGAGMPLHAHASMRTCPHTPRGHCPHLHPCPPPHHLAAIGYPLPLDYQWYRNDVPVRSEKGKVLSISPVQIRHLGTYKCVVTNAAGDATSSNPVTLEFTPAEPMIVSQPAGKSVHAGDTAELQVVGALAALSRLAPPSAPPHASSLLTASLVCFLHHTPCPTDVPCASDPLCSCALCVVLCGCQLWRFRRRSISGLRTAHPSGAPRRLS
jgi:hypothetical protein